MEDDEESDDEEVSEDTAWIPWYCALKGHEPLVEIEEDFIRDNFNLYGLRGRFSYYDHALEMILSSAPDEEDMVDAEFMEIYRDATDLFAVIHSRYIISPRGMQIMREKYIAGVFGYCPRVLCDKQHVLPIGAHDELRLAPQRVFCPKCEQCYVPRGKYKELDGAHFGPSFPQIFLQTYPSLVPVEAPRPFVPRIFGFKVHKQQSIIQFKLDNEQGAIRTSKTGAPKPAEEDTSKATAMEGVSGGAAAAAGAAENENQP